jgi:hypothetical protein
MPVTEHTPQRLILRSSGTTLTLSRESGKATLQRKLLFWNLKPSEAPLTDITEVTVDAAVDRASGVEVCSTTFVMRTGAGWAFPCSDKRDAQATAETVRGFPGLSPPE